MRNRIFLLLGIWVGVFAVGYFSVKESARVIDGKQEEKISVAMESLAATTKAAIDTEIILLGNRLADLVGIEAGLRQTTEQMGQFSPLSKAFDNSDFIGAFVLSKKGTGRGDLLWSAVPENSQSRVTQTLIENWNNQIPFSSIKNTRTYFNRVLDQSNRPLFTVTLELKLQRVNVQQNQESSEQVYAVGIISPQFFERLAASVKLSGDEFILVDQNGYALTFTETQYVGAKLDKHPIVNEVLKSRDASGSGKFLNLYGEEVVGAYTRFSESNIYLAVATKTSLFKTQLFPAFVSTLLYVIVVGLFLSALTFAFKSQGLGMNASDFKDSLTKLASGKTLDFPNGEKVEFAEHAHFFSPHVDADEKIIPNVEPAKLSEVDKQKVIDKMGVGLSDALSGPMSAILGHSQLARSKSLTEDVKEHFVIIERESRKAKELLDNLVRSAGGSELPKKRVEIQETLLACLAGYRSDISSKGIQLRKDLATTGTVLAQSSLLQAAFNEIIKNSIESMEATSEKDLSISSEISDKVIEVKVKDTGVGISPDKLGKVFDPFYSEKDNEKNLGMGLNTAMGIFKSFDGEIHIESKVGQGTEVTVSLPLQASSRMERVSHEELGEKTDVAIPAESFSEETKKVDLNNLEEEMTNPKINHTVSSELTNPSVSAKLMTELTDPKISESISAEITSPTIESALDPVPMGEEKDNTFEVMAISENTQPVADNPSLSESTEERLAGKAPISGSKAAELPTAPSIDEITFTGVLPEVEALTTEQTQIPTESAAVSEVNEEEKKSSAESLASEMMSELSEEEDEEKKDVPVRSPKVRY